MSGFLPGQAVAVVTSLIANLFEFLILYAHNEYQCWLTQVRLCNNLLKYLIHSRAHRNIYFV